MALCLLVIMSLSRAWKIMLSRKIFLLLLLLPPWKTVENTGSRSWEIVWQADDPVQQNIDDLLEDRRYLWVPTQR